MTLAKTRRRIVARSFALILAALAAACAPVPRTVTPPAAEPAPAAAPALELVEVSFSYLPGWAQDGQAAALRAFRVSCDAVLKKPADAALGGEQGSGGTAGRVRDWRPACEAARAVPDYDTAARAFFEHYFVPWLATDRGRPDGLFTGYYEAELRGSWQRTARFKYPVFGRPADLVDVDLGLFRPDLKGTKIAGRLDGRRLVPYADRAAIDHGALAGKGLELLYVDDPADAFFLHVQGSGRVRMTDGSVVRLGFAGRNGLPYTAIGKTLIDQYKLPSETMSMKTIRQWIKDNPGPGKSLMATNASFIFFAVQSRADGGPTGAQGVALTPGRSLAVDRRFVPLGVPVWLDTTDPSRRGAPLRRLMVAQDTGGAITGPVRGDVFWGYGEEAASAAGAMKETGRAYLLLPNGVKPGEK